MSNIDTKKFIKLMNKECDSNGHSPTFRAGEEAILKSQDPYFVYDCINRIRYINVSKLSAHLAGIPLTNYTVGDDDAVVNFIAINKDMMTKPNADTQAHILNLLSVNSISKNMMADTLSSCLNVARRCCLELVPTIIKRLLTTEILSWLDFENCYRQYLKN